MTDPLSFASIKTNLEERAPIKTRFFGKIFPKNKMFNKTVFGLFLQKLAFRESSENQFSRPKNQFGRNFLKVRLHPSKKYHILAWFADFSLLTDFYCVFMQNS